MKNNLLILDCETGGLDYSKHPITQIALEIIDPIHFNHITEYETFIKPYNDLIITPEALKASRVSMQEINDGLAVELLMRELIAKFKAANKSGHKATKPILVGHNFGFDINFLRYLFEYRNQNIFDYISENFIDTLTLCKLYEAGSLKSNENNKFTLTACCERFGIELRGAHGAMADIKATKQLLIKLISLLRNGDAENIKSDAGRTKKARDEFFFEF